ncbi:alpha-L-fucosidase, partial [Bifidobacterium longum]
MVLFMANPQRPKMYEKFVHDTPEWFKGAGLGIFAHWGSYSVPAWAEPIGALGTFDDPVYWNTHCPYAEWYWNTMSIKGSPAAEHQKEVYGDMPYEDFIDMWKAEAFDPADMADLFARAGARYFVPTTKHHEGITLWKAPDNDGWNTVDRGPHRDLVKEFADAMR